MTAGQLRRAEQALGRLRAREIRPAEDVDRLPDELRCVLSRLVETADGAAWPRASTAPALRGHIEASLGGPVRRAWAACGAVALLLLIRHG